MGGVLTRVTAPQQQGGSGSAASRVAITVTGDRVRKSRLLMAGLGEEIRGLWDTLARIEAAPVPGGRLDISDDSIFDVLNWLRRALTSIRSLDHEVFTNSDKAGYEAVRAVDPRGMAVRGLTAPRNNAVHHPEVVDPGVDRAMGPFGEDGRYLIFPVWVQRTQSLDPMFTQLNGKFSKSYAAAYDAHVAGRSLYDPLLDAFDFFDSLAPTLARRDSAGQLAHFPLPPPPIMGAGDLLRLMPSSPNERKQRKLLDLQQRFHLELASPEGQERVITGAIKTDDDELVLTGYTVLSDAHQHAFLERLAQVESDIRRGFPYLVSVSRPAPATGTEPVHLKADLTLVDGRPLPSAELLAAEISNAEILGGRWELCQEDANYYGSFRMPFGRWPSRPAVDH